MKHTMNKIGVSYAVLFCISLFGGFVLEFINDKLMPGILPANAGNAALIEMIISFYLVGFLTLLLLVRKMPKAELGHKKLNFGRYIMLIFMTAALVGIGAVIGLIPDRLIGFLVGSNGANPLGTVMTDSNPILRVITIGILAPVFEEMMFRKILIDRVAVKGKFLAILTSGIFFGLMHGNFSQFFYATLLGFLFAYIYLETGNVLYTMGLHIIINMSSSVLTLGLGAYNANRDSIWLLFIVGWFAVELLAVMAGMIVWLVVLTKKKVRIPKEDESFGKQAKKLVSSWGVMVYTAIGILAFVMMYLLSGKVSAEIPKVTSKAANVFTMDINISDQAENKPVIPPLEFTVDTAGKYELDFSWNVSKDSEPAGFLIGVAVQDENGKTVNAMTGGGVYAECPTDLEAGRYIVNYSILTNEEEYRDFVLKYVDAQYDDECDFEFRDGSCHMEFAFDYRKMK